MSTVTVIDCPAARFAVKTKRGEKLDITFTIVGQAALNDDAWSAKLRGKNRVLPLGVSKSVTTVDYDRIRREVEQRVAPHVWAARK